MSKNEYHHVENLILNTNLSKNSLILKKNEKFVKNSTDCPRDLYNAKLNIYSIWAYTCVLRHNER